jgi:hypothetical protein
MNDAPGSVMSRETWATDSGALAGSALARNRWIRIQRP